jgi:hypothetical protein
MCFRLQSSRGKLLVLTLATVARDAHLLHVKYDDLDLKTGTLDLTDWYSFCTIVRGPNPNPNPSGRSRRILHI